MKSLRASRGGAAPRTAGAAPSRSTSGAPDIVLPTIASAQARRSAGSPPVLLVEAAPEGRHVLRELAHDEVAAVAAEVGERRLVLGARQAGGAHRVEQRTGGVEAVLVRIAEHELAQAGEVAVVEPQLVAHRPAARPVGLGLRDAVGEAEGLDAVELAVSSATGGSKPAAHCASTAPAKAASLPGCA